MDKRRCVVGLALGATLALAGRGIGAPPLDVCETVPACQTLDEAADKTLALRDIAALGDAGRSAGPKIVSLLGSSDAGTRVAAARALGFIGYSPSAPSLAVALDDADDWRLVYAAAEALGQLRATDWRQALEATAGGHWYPLVREAARQALQALDSKRPSATTRVGSAFGSEFFSYDQAGHDLAPCADRARFPAAPPPPEGLDPTGEPALAEQLAYERDITSFDGHGTKHTSRRRTVPEVGLRVERGWLVGGDHGEWGGELVFRSDAGTTRKILTTNVSSLHLLNDGQIVAVTGLAHLSLDAGVLYQVVCPTAETCRATRWKQLPAAPSSSWLTETGELLVNTSRGSVLVASDGTMRMADCHQGDTTHGESRSPRPQSR